VKGPRLARTAVPKASYSSFRLSTPDYDPELIWVMGYPYTGPGVTLKIIEFGTNKSMATNYGDHLEDYDGEEYVAQYEAHAINPVKYPDGPFWHNMDMERDSPILLVKTHCGGTCMHEEGVNCTAKEYIDEMSTYTEWRKACHVGRSFKPSVSSTKKRRLLQQAESRATDAVPDDVLEDERSRRLFLKTLQKRTNAKAGKRARTNPYPVTKVNKAILTVRNPFVIIASRFRQAGKFDEFYNQARFNHAGMTMWCAKIDEQHKGLQQFESFRDRENLVGDVPCWTELFRLANWYKNACRLLADYDYRVVHFEDYTTKPEETVQSILEFTGLKFMQGKWIRFGQYSPIYNWFTEDQLIKMANYMVSIMRPDCVAPLFSRYFADGWIHDVSVTNNWGH
jgi:hypothetical protein